MQDRYVGDIGDFGKLGLLRMLCGPDQASRLSLGVVWYLVENESHNKDGKHITYLDDPRDFKCCDSELYNGLRRLRDDDHGKLVSGWRSVARIESSGLLPADTRFFRDSLSFQGALHVEDKRRLRREWLDRALRATATADIVFLDPDNGIECKTVRYTSKKAAKYAFWDEIEAFAVRKQTVVVYHHVSRLGTSQEQVTRLRQEFEKLLPSFTILDVIFRRGTQRAYFIAAPVNHRGVLICRLCNMFATPWNHHFTFSPLLKRQCLTPN